MLETDAFRDTRPHFPIETITVDVNSIQSLFPQEFQLLVADVLSVLERFFLRLGALCGLERILPIAFDEAEFLWCTSCDFVTCSDT